LGGADWPFAVDGFGHMAALSEDGQEIGRPSAGMLHQESEAFGWSRIVRRHGVTPIVILDQKPQEAHELGFLWRSGSPLANEIAEAVADGTVLLLGLNHLRASFSEKFLVTQSGHSSEILPFVSFMCHDGLDKQQFFFKVHAGHQTVLVSADIEDQGSAPGGVIRRRKRLLYFQEGLPVGAARNLQEPPKRSSGIGISFREFAYRRFAKNRHFLMFPILGAKIKRFVG
jgi:hypothetical protein